MRTRFVQSRVTAGHRGDNGDQGIIFSNNVFPPFDLWEDSYGLIHHDGQKHTHMHTHEHACTFHAHTMCGSGVPLQLGPYDYRPFHFIFMSKLPRMGYTHTHTHIINIPFTHTHTHFHYAAIHSATALYTQAPGAPGERKGSANKLSPGPELRFQPSVHRGWEAMGTWSARGPVSIRSSGSTQWGPACRQHCWQIYTQKSLWMGRRLVHTFTRVNTHTHRIKNRAVCGCPQCQCLMITSLCVHIAQQTAVLMPTRK